MDIKRETFQSPYKEYNDKIGLGFEILGESDNPDKDETGPLYNIKMADGTTIVAWPEEIFSGTGWEPEPVTV